MANLTEFRQKITEYRNQATPYGDNRRPSQRELAVLSNMNEGDFSRSLNGLRQFTQEEVRRIIRGLAEWEVITTKQQAQELLALMDCPDFTPAQWGAEPLCQLIDNPHHQTTVNVNPKVKVEPAMSETDKFQEYKQLRSQLDALHDKLMDCGSMSNLTSLEITVNQLPKLIRRNIDLVGKGTLPARVSLVVDACMGVEGGLEVLIRAMAFFDRGTIAFNKLIAFLAANGINIQLDSLKN